ncbi:MAG: hypothetical protein RL456_1603 [Pseudomonadota bacterium]
MRSTECLSLSHCNSTDALFRNRLFCIHARLLTSLVQRNFRRTI